MELNRYLNPDFAKKVGRIVAISSVIASPILFAAYLRATSIVQESSEQPTPAFPSKDSNEVYIPKDVLPYQKEDIKKALRDIISDKYQDFGLPGIPYKEDSGDIVGSEFLIRDQDTMNPLICTVTNTYKEGVLIKSGLRIANGLNQPEAKAVAYETEADNGDWRIPAKELQEVSQALFNIQQPQFKQGKQSYPWGEVDAIYFSGLSIEGKQVTGYFDAKGQGIITISVESSELNKGKTAALVPGRTDTFQGRLAQGSAARAANVERARSAALTQKYTTPTTELVTPQEGTELKEAIEQQFNIELYNPAKAVVSYVEPHTSGIPIQWDEARLNTLRGSLLELPEHFYQPSVQGRRLRLELTTGRFSVTSRDDIGFSFVQFDPSKPREALSSLTREFVYRVMPTTTLPDGSKNSPWFDKLEQTLGEDWMKTSYQIGHSLNNRLYSGGIKGLEEKDFYQRTYTSLGIDAHAGFSLSPKNFIANSAVDYTRGNDYFTRMYGQFFAADTVTQLYNFIKEDIFRGKEY